MSMHRRTFSFAALILTQLPVGVAGSKEPPAPAPGCSAGKTPVYFRDLFKPRTDDTEIHIVWDESTQCLVVTPATSHPGPWVLEGRHLVFDGGEVWIEAPTQIRSFSPNARAKGPTTAPPQPKTPAALGTTGDEGIEGEPGPPGRNGSNVLMNVTSLHGATLTFFLDGEDGATGGPGGKGADGSMGPRGSHQACRKCRCKGDSSGGRGGDGGRAGRGGPGGDGGAAGTCRYARALESAVRAGALRVSAKGGAGGQGGSPGLPGAPGAGGPGGDSKSCCTKHCPKGGGGPGGSEGKPNESGGPGKRGASGDVIATTLGPATPAAGAQKDTGAQE